MGPRVRHKPLKDPQISAGWGTEASGAALPAYGKARVVENTDKQTVFSSCQDHPPGFLL